MLRYRAILLVLAVAACNQDAAGENSPTLPADRESAATTTVPSPYGAGQTLRVLRQVPCRETGPEAGEPWNMKVGAFVDFVRVEGSEARVETAPGMECVMAPDALAPA